MDRFAPPFWHPRCCLRVGGVHPIIVGATALTGRSLNSNNSATMSHEIPVFTAVVDGSNVSGRDLTYDQALNLIPEDPWLSTSRNWWYQGLVCTLLDTYAGFSEADYLIRIVAVVEQERLTAAAEAIHGLIEAIKENPEPFATATSWYGASHEEIRRNIAEATVSRYIDDDCIYAFSNFFSFLASQMAALEEAKLSEKCLLYVQAQP